MKKLLAAVLVMCMLFALTGCGNSEPKLNDNAKRWISDEADQQVVLNMFAELKEILADNMVNYSIEHSERDVIFAYSDHFRESIEEAFEESGAYDILSKVYETNEFEKDEDATDAALWAIGVFGSCASMELAVVAQDVSDIEKYYGEFCKDVAQLADIYLKNKDYFKGCPGFENIY